ncbi:uncharacterized protein LOC110841656 [Folsomia candida]|uniref:uncharacterized protein LOC110841656 n=1 Tax=Folsomia candida TaxID=158441 RepID=UPI000B8F3A67|nr:uncharacterized protein LOC110841656 [Folsomia candida]XP_035713163.1 uncharacterized protein LOC110841656 [Folsomia candida]XP_035713167.1 uncharacterized protein LOC110841656 [Folsomia candida]XP_035713171.1 uncharacterized protein LOC110841656 [Folsomia candida]
MGLDPHFSKTKSKSSISTIGKTDVFWDNVNQNQNQECEEKPSILEFNIFISNSGDLISSRDLDPCIHSFRRRRTNSVYEIPVQNSLLAAKEIYEECLELSLNKISKKSVRFSEDTNFIERNMNRPFWKELAERKIRRKILREQRRRRQQQRSMTFFDMLRLLFASKKHNSANPANGQNLGGEMTQSHLLQTLQHSAEDLNSSSFSETPIFINEVDTKKPTELETRKNSKVHKMLRSMQMWWRADSNDLPIQQMQIN